MTTAERPGVSVHDLGSGPVDVLALHGITGNGLAFTTLSRELAGTARVLAPDLRGRAESAGLRDSDGLISHVDDLIDLLDRRRLGRVVLIGHSMGAYVAALAGSLHPDRFTHLVLVDGGIAFPPPPDVDIDAALDAVVGPAVRRLAMTFASAEDYLAFWGSHPAVAPLLTGPTAADVREHLLHDLVSDGSGGWRSSCVAAVVRADGAGVLTDTRVHRAVGATTVPLTLLHAERGMLDQPAGLLSSADIAAAALPTGAVVELIPDTNHYSILLGAAGARAVAAAVRAALAADPGSHSG